jgi:ribose 1,5-bisphosphate isomerase
MDIVRQTVNKIKELKIQGASNVRDEAINALLKASVASKAENEEDFRREFLKNAQMLYTSRPTEPELRTGIRIVKKSISQKGLNVEEMKKKIIEAVKKYEHNRERAIEKMAEFGANLIENDSTILTICHSSTVVKTLIRAKKKIKKVYCVETRPLYQGRITAKELASAGIDVTLIVDNAASTVMKECDYFFSGADAFLADGDVVNKIGTNNINGLCTKYDVKHYVVMSSHKFEPATFLGKLEPIEERSANEVWEEKEKKKFGAGRVKIKNMAFDRTDSAGIEGIICELGVFPPQVLASKLYSMLEVTKHEKDFLKL